MTTHLHAESNTQFIARMLVATREGQQIVSADAQRLNDLATFGVHQNTTTMPEERRQASYSPSGAMVPG